MSSTEIDYWRRWVRSEKESHNDKLIYAWLKNTMLPAEIEALTKAINKYYPDLKITIKKDNSGKVERQAS